MQQNQQEKKRKTRRQRLGLLVLRFEQKKELSVLSTAPFFKMKNLLEGDVSSFPFPLLNVAFVWRGWVMGRGWAGIQTQGPLLCWTHPRSLTHLLMYFSVLFPHGGVTFQKDQVQIQNI